MKKEVLLFLVVGLFMLNFVSGANMFYDDFEDGVQIPEWMNWVEDISGVGTWIIKEISSSGLGNGEYAARAFFWSGQVRLVMKNSINLVGNLNCKISFYSAAVCTDNCPTLTMDYYDGSNWGTVTSIDLAGAKALQHNEFSIDDSDLSEDAKIRFVVTGSEKNGYVYLDDVSIDCATTDMEVSLDSPYCGEYFMRGSTSQIKVSASDIDDVITGNVSIDGISIMDFSNGGNTTSHTWDKAGNIQIELYAENGGGFEKRKITSVMVVDPTTPDKYLAACMDEPSEFVDITSTNVYFNAGSTRGLINESGTIEVVDKSDLLFSWKFSDGLINFHHDPDESELAWKFYKNFATAGDNWAILDVEFK